MEDQLISETDRLQLRFYIRELSERLGGPDKVIVILSAIQFAVKEEKLTTKDIVRAISREQNMAWNRRLKLSPGGRPSKVRQYVSNIQFYRSRGREDLAQETLQQAKAEVSKPTFYKIIKALKESEKKRWGEVEDG